MNILTQWLHFPSFFILDGVAKHFVEDALRQSVEVAQLGFLQAYQLVDFIQLRDDGLLLRQRRDGDFRICNIS